ncbi:MAG TPA: ABC transporter substrate-binding protein [Dehalococcoidia bacterium]|nr:ABC transporter substrate-binding protein [Dehalococcoidia bacterium]
MSDFDRDSYWQRLQQSRANRRRVLAGGATVLTGGIALGLVGCSSSNNNSGGNAANNTAAPSAASGAAGTTAPTRAGAAAPGGSPAASAGGPAAGAAPTVQAFDSKLKTGGTVQIRIVGTANLDPVANTTYRSQWLAGFHYARLFRFAAANDPQVTLSRIPVPDLVESFENSDPTTFTMHLRKGVMYHPPLSRQLTSADVLSSWDYFNTNPKNSNNTVYKPIVDSLTAPDDFTLQFKLKGPYAPFLNKLANTQYLWILSKDAVDGKIDPAQQAVGVGPWIFDSSTPTAFTWKKNPNYWNKGLPYADGVVLNIIPDTSTVEAQYQAGKLDILIAGDPPTADADAVKKAVPKSQTYEYSPNGMSFLFFSHVNDANSPFKDPRVRQAASMAVDRQGLIDNIYNGKAAWENIVNAGLGKWYLDPQGKDAGDSARYFKFNKDQAKQLLAASGQANTQFSFYYPNNAYGDVFNASADAVRGMLADAGFKIQAVPVDYLKDWIDTTNGMWAKGMLPPNGIGFGLQTPFTDPDDFLTGMLTKDGNRNHDLLDDPDLAALVQKQKVELDENKRLQEVYDVQRAQADKMYYAPLIYTHYINFTQPWVQNFYNVDDYDFGTEMIAYMSVNNK